MQASGNSASNATAWVYGRSVSLKTCAFICNVCSLPSASLTNERINRVARSFCGRMCSSSAPSSTLFDQTGGLASFVFRQACFLSQSNPYLNAVPSVANSSFASSAFSQHQLRPFFLGFDPLFSFGLFASRFLRLLLRCFRRCRFLVQICQLFVVRDTAFGLFFSRS